MIRNKVMWDKHYNFNRLTVRNIFLFCYSRFRLMCIFNGCPYIFLIYYIITIYICLTHFYDLSALVGRWSSVSIRRIIYKCLNVCPFDYTAVALSGKV